jgi:hypothetical protein
MTVHTVSLISTPVSPASRAILLPAPSDADVVARWLAATTITHYRTEPDRLFC